MDNKPLVTVVKQENPMKVDTTPKEKMIINITLRKSNIFNETNSEHGKKILQDFGNNQRRQKSYPNSVAENGENNYDESSDWSLVSQRQSLNASQTNLKKCKSISGKSCPSDTKMNVKLEQSDLKPELFKALGEKTSVPLSTYEVDEIQNSEVDNKKHKLHSRIQAKRLPENSDTNKCSKCKKSFSWRKTLVKHLKICGKSEDYINSLKRYVCDHCNYKTNDKSHLARHIQEKHLPRDPDANKCKKCNKSFFQRSSLLTHLKICNKSEDEIRSLKRYTCDNCSYKTHWSGDLNKHIKIQHLPRDPDANKCKKCNKSFFQRSSLLTHLKICNKSEDEIRSLKRYTCDNCSYKTHWSGDLNKHIKIQHLPRDPNANKCIKCEKRFSWRKTLLRHLKVCGLSKDQIHLLKRHTCDHCGYKTNNKVHLVTHIQDKHLPRDPDANKCSKCKKNFSQRSYLLTHFKICGQSKDFVRSLCRYTCDHCNFKTNNKTYLTRHIKAKHLPRDHKANECNKCKKSFSWRSSLLKHSRICDKQKNVMSSNLY